MVFIPTEIDLALVNCCACGIQFGVPAQLNQSRLEDKEPWSCPNGHSQSYVGRPVRALLAETEHAYRTVLQERDVAQANAARKAKQLAALKRRVKETK